MLTVEPDLSILCLYGASFVGGVDRVLRQGLPLIAKTQGIRLRLADIYARDEILKGFESLGVKTDPCVGARGKPYVSAHRGARRRLDQAFAAVRHMRIVAQIRAAARRYAVVYVHGYKELVLVCAAQATGWCPKCRVVWHCHGLDDGDVPPLLSQMAQRCTGIIAISKSVRQRLVDIASRRAALVYNAVDYEQIRKEASLGLSEALPDASGNPVVLIPSASLRAVKGAHVVIEALQHCHTPLDLWITGDPNDPTAGTYVNVLREIIARVPSKHHVWFIGFRRDMYAVMARADIVCVPSVCREGFGLVAAEAMSLRKPVVVSCKGALPEVVEDGVSGLVFDTDVPELCAAQLDLLASNYALARRLGEAGRNRVLRYFNYENWRQDVARELRYAAVARSAGEPATRGSRPRLWAGNR